MGASHNSIGDGFGGNVISGNVSAGVQIDGASTSLNSIQGNKIGVNAAGTAALANGGIGVWLSNSPTQNTIGGTSVGLGNVISGNLGGGVDIDGNVIPSNNVLQSNFIGTNFNGTASLGNLNYGVLVQGSSNDLIGGATSGSGNVISGNLGDGLILDGLTAATTANLVHSNYIGTNASGANLGNAGDGILIENGASSNIIGSNASVVVAGAGNIIAFNTLAGVAVTDDTSSRNSIRGNSIYANGGLGIDLTGYGNKTQAVPTVIAAAVDSTALTTQIKATFAGTLPSLTTYQLDFYDNQTTTDPSGFGQGRNYLGSTTVSTDANGILTSGSNTFFSLLNASLPVGDILTITVTDQSGNTSQFSNDVNAILLPKISASGLGVAVRGQRLSYTISPSATPSDLAAGFNYQASFSDGTAPQSFSSAAVNVTTPIPHFYFVNQDTPYSVSATITATDQFGFTATATVTTTMELFALENNNTELDVGAAFGGSSFVLTGILAAGNKNFELNVDNGNPIIASTDSDIAPFLSNLTSIQLWGNDTVAPASNPLNPAGNNSFNTEAFVGSVQTHNGPGDNFVNSTSLVYSADAVGDNVTYIASPTATNSLSFAGSDTAVTFDLGKLDGTPQNLTASNDMLTILGGTNSNGQVINGAISNLTASDENDTFMIPSDYTALVTPGKQLSVTGGAGNDTFTITNPTTVGANDTFTIDNTSFVSGGGNDTFTTGGNNINNTFTINKSSLAGNDTFTIGGSSTVSNAFAISGSTLSGSDTFTIGSGNAVNDTFTIDNASTLTNDTFTIGGAAAGAVNDTFTINNNGMLAGSDTFTANNSDSAANDTFTINNGASFAPGVFDTFTITDLGASSDTFVINGGLDSSAGSSDTFVITSAGPGQDTFTINGGVNTLNGASDTFTIGGNSVASDTFTINGGITAGVGDTFTIGANAGTSDTFTINGGITTSGGGLDTFTIGSGNATQDTFTIGSITNNGSSDTFTIGSGASSLDTFTIGSITDTGSGVNDTFIVQGGLGTSDTFTIGGGTGMAIDAGGVNDTFTINDIGASSDAFKINGGVTFGSVGTADHDSFALASTGMGQDTFTITGSVTASGASSDTFIIQAGSGSLDTFTIMGGVTATGTGNNVFVMNSTGAAAGKDSMIVNSSFTGGAGSDTFIIQDTATGASSDTFTINGNIDTGAGNNAFIMDAGAGKGISTGNDTFTINGAVTASGSGLDTFTITNQTITNGAVSGTSAGSDTFVITGGIDAAGSSGSDTFTIGSTGISSDTFTIGSAGSGTAGIIEGSGNNTLILTQGGGASDTFIIQGGVVATGAGNDTFVINNAGAGAGVSDTFTLNGNLTGGAGNNQFFVQDTSTTASNDTVIINGSFFGLAGRNDAYVVTNAGLGNDTFTINGVIAGGGTGADSFELINSGPGNDNFTILGGLHDAGTGGDTFLLSNTGNGSDNFTITSGIVFGSGEDLFSINTLGNGNNNITINGNVALGNADDTFFVISQAGDGNNTIKIAGSVTAGNGSDFMTLGTSGAGTDAITITGPVTYGNGADSFQLNGSGTGNATFNLLGGVSGQGFDTYTIEDPGAVSGDESMTVNGNFGGGAGSDTFILTGGLNNHNGKDTFALNGNLIGGAGSNTFSVTDSGLSSNSFTLSGVLQGGSNDQGDVFELAGLYQTVHLASGSSTGTGDTYEFSGAVQGTFIIQDPDQANRTDTLDFSTLNSGVTVNLGSTAAQAIAPGLNLQLSDANGFSNVIGTAYSDTIYGNARTNLLQAADALDSSYQANAPGVGANGKLQVVLLDFDTAFNQANGVFNFNTFYATAGKTPLHVYTMAERQAILQAIETDYAPFLAQFNAAGQMTQAGIYFTTNPYDKRLMAAGTNYITEFFDQSVPAGGDEPTSPTGAAASSQFEPGGTSSDLDFRDADMTGAASIQVNGILGEPLQPASTETNWITLSTKIAAHELGHLLGLHHADSFGPIGDGIMPLPAGANYNPAYTGPIDANETFNHIITSGDSVGADRWNDLRDVFFGEREDVVLAFSFAAPATPSNPATVTAANPSLFVGQQQTPTKPISQTSAQPLYLAPISVPNTETYGRDAGKTFEAQAVDVQGSIGLVNGLAEQDYYSFTGNTGDVMNVNVMSQGITRYADLGTSGYIDPVVFLYQVNADGTLTQVAYNDDVFSASADGDASLVDVTLPCTGSYVIKVTSFSFAGEGALDGATTPTQAEIQAAASQISDPTQRASFLQNTEDAVNGTDTGNYEMFVYRFKAGVTASSADTVVPGKGPATIVGGGGNGDVLQNTQATNPVSFTGSTLPITVATFTSLSGSGKYSANISWGDSFSSPGTISINGNQVSVLGSHSYSTPGTYNISIAITEDTVTVDVFGQVTVNAAAATTTTLTSSAPNNTSVYSQAVTFKATVATTVPGSGTPSGSVDFVDTITGHDLGTFALQNGYASVSISALAAEGHVIQANYITNIAAFLTSSGSVTQTVKPYAFTYQIQSTSQTYGSPVNLNTALGATISTGVNGENLAIAYSSTGDTATASVGTYPITGVLSNGSGLTSNYTVTLLCGTLTVNSALTTTKGSASLSAPSFGQTETFTAAVATNPPGIGTPTGKVDFYDTTTAVDLGSVTIVSGIATLSTSSLPLGKNVITLTYSGDGTFLSSNIAVTVTVGQSIIVLDPTANGALTLSGNANINVLGTVVVDSKSTTALNSSGSAKLTATSIQVVGGSQKTGNATFSPAPVTGAKAEVDPLAALMGPGTSGLTNYGAGSFSGSGSKTLSPGIYSSITISGNIAATFNPGIYIIEGGGFSVSGNATVTGTGVFIFNTGSKYPSAGGTYGAINLSGNGGIKLTGPSTGVFAGIMIDQDSNDTQALNISGNASGMSGLIYAPKAQVVLSGNAQLNATLDVDLLTISGNGVENGLSSPSGMLAYTPDQVRTAYGINALGASGTAGLDGTGQTIAIVDAYNDPSIFQSLDTFDTQFGLTVAGSSLYQQFGPASSFLTVLNQNGQPTSLPITDPIGQGADNWEVEEALDVEWAHAIAPGAKIILVEADSQALSDLMASVATAAGQQGVSVVSMSWGFQEGQNVLQSDEAAYDSYFTTPGVTFVASTGDYGAAFAEYPAFSPNVLAVGGSSLLVNADSSYNSESGWGYYSTGDGTFIGSGGGLSQYESEPAYQANVQSTGSRTTPDVSFLADPATGVWIADNFNLSADSSFEVVGGTSLSAPSWAGLLALTNQARVASGESTLNANDPTETQQALYALPQSAFNVIASGFNGFNAGTGYNLVTGLGTPQANLLVPDLVAWTGAGTNYQGSAVRPLQAANLVYHGTTNDGSTSIVNVFDALSVATVGNTLPVVQPQNPLPSSLNAANLEPNQNGHAVKGQAAVSPTATQPVSVGPRGGTTEALAGPLQFQLQLSNDVLPPGGNRSLTALSNSSFSITAGFIGTASSGEYCGASEQTHFLRPAGSITLDAALPESIRNRIQQLPQLDKEPKGVLPLSALTEESSWLSWEPTAPATALESVLADFGETGTGSFDSSEPQGSESWASADPCLALAAALALVQFKPDGGKRSQDRERGDGAGD